MPQSFCKDGKKSKEQQQAESSAAEAEAVQMELEVQQETQKGMLESAWGYLPKRLRGEKSSGDAESKAAASADTGVLPEVKKVDAGAWASSIAGGGKEGLNKASGWASGLAGGLMGGGGKPKEA